MEKQPRKSRKKWTVDDRAYADILTGNLPTKDIAKKLNRSVKAIQHHYDVGGISPLDGDGRITLAELSRRNGTPLQTLVEWANMGKLAGVEKVGAYWRVDTSQIGNIQPIWDGKKYLPKRLEELGLIEGIKLNSCINCGLELSKGSNYYCSKKCRGEDMGYFKDRQLTGEDKPEHKFPPYLRLPYQDFLAGVGILKRNNYPGLLTSDPTSSAPIRERMQPLKEELERLKGYVLPSRHVYKVINNEEYEGEYAPKTLRRQMFDLRNTLANPGVISLSRRLGYGLDAHIEMQRIPVMVLRVLWQKEGIPVGMDYLMRNIKSNGLGISYETMMKSIGQIRPLLSENEYRILTIPQPVEAKNGGGKYLFLKAS